MKGRGHWCFKMSGAISQTELACPCLIAGPNGRPPSLVERSEAWQASSLRVGSGRQDLDGIHELTTTYIAPMTYVSNFKLLVAISVVMMFHEHGLLDQTLSASLICPRWISCKEWIQCTKSVSLPSMQCCDVFLRSMFAFGLSKCFI